MHFGAIRSPGLVLALRLEAAEAANGMRCAEAQQGAAVECVGGGCAIFAGVNSMLTHATGLGLQGPVSIAEMDRMEAFFRSRGAAVNVDLCPYAHPTLIGHVGARGYRLTEFAHTVVRAVSDPAEAPAGACVREADPGEARLWAQTVGAGFFERDNLPPDELEVGLTLFRARGFRCFFAMEDGAPAAAAAMSIHEGVALFFADSTLRARRHRGHHTALIRARLEEARRAGCDLAAAAVLPGSASARNYQRLGFQVAYTKATLTR